MFDIDAIDVNDPANAKHTETTQRFGCSLVRGSGVRLPARVEFSRRSDDPGGTALSELLDAALHWPDYEGQVVEYLDADSRAEFANRKAWVALQNSVFEALQNRA